MDLGSIKQHSRHIHNVQRLQTELEESGSGNHETKLESQIEQAKLRWLNCRRSFVMMFMMLNRGNKFPEDEFHIKINSETHGNGAYDTYVRIWRSKDHKTYHVKPYVDCGSNIIDHSFETESFGNEYVYRFGTQGSHIAKIVVSSEVDIADVQLSRVDGYEVEDMTVANQAILLSALEDAVLPKLEDTESTLMLVADSILNHDLNPRLARNIA